ncbi:MAG: ComF family protein [Salinibacter sp.]
MLEEVSHTLRTVGRGLLDLLYPPRCLGCGARPETAERPLCSRCLQSLERAAPMDVAARLDRLPAGGDLFEHVLALWVFDRGGPLQAVQHAVKYGDRPRYGVALGRLVGQAYAEAAAPPDGVVPVPLHRTRELERGYNQSRVLADGVADALNAPLRTSLLARPHPARSQTNLSRAERWRNVQDAFAADPACADAHWLLVDDVLTTGSTAVAAGRALADAGAEAVSLATLALARQ